MVRIGANSAVFQSLEGFRDLSTEKMDRVSDVATRVLSTVREAEGSESKNQLTVDPMNNVGREVFTSPKEAMLETVVALATLDASTRCLKAYLGKVGASNSEEAGAIAQILVRLKEKKDVILDNLASYPIVKGMSQMTFGEEGVKAAFALVDMEDGVKTEHAVAILKLKVKLGVSDEILSDLLSLEPGEETSLFSFQGFGSPIVKEIALSEIVADAAEQACHDSISSRESVAAIIRGVKVQTLDDGALVSEQLANQTSAFTLFAGGKTVTSKGQGQLEKMCDAMGVEVAKTQLLSDHKQKLHLAAQEAISEATAVGGLGAYDTMIKDLALRMGVPITASLVDKECSSAVSKVPGRDALNIHTIVTFSLASTDPKVPAMGTVTFERDYELSISQDGIVEVSKYSIVSKPLLISAETLTPEDKARVDNEAFLEAAYQKGLEIKPADLEAQLNKQIVEADNGINKEFAKDVLGFRIPLSVKVAESPLMTIKAGDVEIPGKPEEVRDAIKSFARSENEELALQFLLTNTGSYDAPAYVTFGANFVDSSGNNPLNEFGAWGYGPVRTKFSRNVDGSVNVETRAVQSARIPLGDGDETDAIELEFHQSYDVKEVDGRFVVDNYETPTMKLTRVNAAG